MIAAISDKCGLIGAHTKDGAAFDAQDVRKFVRDVKKDAPGPFALLIDNARIHVARENLAWFEEQGITVIRNLPYRPDLMGIEDYWGLLKRQYRPKVRKNLVEGTHWN